MDKKEMIEFMKNNRKKLVCFTDDSLIVGNHVDGGSCIVSDMGGIICKVDINTFAEWTDWKIYEPPCTWFM